METLTASNETTTWVDRNAVLVSLDLADDRGQSTEMVTLTRLDNAAQSGESLDDNAQTMIRTLRAKLGVQPEKRIVVAGDNYRRLIRANGRPAVMFQPIMSVPLGAYYTKLTIPYALYTAPEVVAAWDANPIENLELSMIPRHASTAALSSHRLGRCIGLSFSFQDCLFDDVLRIVGSVTPQSCLVLELRNVVATDNQKKILKQRVRWPNLFNIIWGK